LSACDRCRRRKQAEGAPREEYATPEPDDRVIFRQGSIASLNAACHAPPCSGAVSATRLTPCMPAPSPTSDADRDQAQLPRSAATILPQQRRAADARAPVASQAQPQPGSRKARLGPGAEGVTNAGGIFKSAAVAILRQERRLMTTGDITR
jgi:hypothetical protein